MKKLLAILAAALLVVACGETKEKPKTIEDQLLEHLAKIEKALETGDLEKVEEANNAWYGWSSSLSGEEAKEHEAAVEKHMERIMEISCANDKIWYGDCEEYEECEEYDYSNIEEQFEKYLTKIESAIADGDIEAAMAANDAMDEWYSSLDEEEMAAFEEATMTYATRTMRIASALEEMQYDEGEDEYDDEGEDEYEDEDWE